MRNERGVTLSDDDLYLIFMLHQNTHMSSEKIARRFGLTTGQVRRIVARSCHSGCCG